MHSAQVVFVWFRISGFRVQGFRVQGSGFRISGFRVQGPRLCGLRDLGVGREQRTDRIYRVRGSNFRAQG